MFFSVADNGYAIPTVFFLRWQESQTRSSAVSRIYGVSHVYGVSRVYGVSHGHREP